MNRDFSYYTVESLSYLHRTQPVYEHTAPTTHSSFLTTQQAQGADRLPYSQISYDSRPLMNYVFGESSNIDIPILGRYTSQSWRSSGIEVTGQYDNPVNYGSNIRPELDTKVQKIKEKKKEDESNKFVSRIYHVEFDHYKGRGDVEISRSTWTEETHDKAMKASSPSDSTRIASVSTLPSKTDLTHEGTNSGRGSILSSDKENIDINKQPRVEKLIKKKKTSSLLARRNFISLEVKIDSIGSKVAVLPSDDSEEEPTEVDLTNYYQPAIARTGFLEVRRNKCYW